MSDLQSKVKEPNRYGAYDARYNVIRCYLDGKLMLTISSDGCDHLGKEGIEHVLWLWVVMGKAVI